MTRTAGMTALLSALLAAGGCEPGVSATNGPASADEQIASLRTDLATLRETNRGLRRDLVAKRERIDTLLRLGDKRLNKLFHVTRITLGRYTGGVDTDDAPGHDAIKVFLRPHDADGSTIKAAGDVAVELYDLAADEGDQRIGTYRWSVDELSAQWSSGFMTYHFSFVCPWDERPAHDEITVRVEFVDYLTGKTHTAQKVCTVDLPADGNK
ncbi:MAG: hypothetical protein KGY99_00860 [Phycisphaerae bacterium]|nr:hypothetical protein [Phycisphaerae bacterium]